MRVLRIGLADILAEPQVDSVHSQPDVFGRRGRLAAFRGSTGHQQR